METTQSTERSAPRGPSGPEQLLEQITRMIGALRKRQAELVGERGLTLLQYSAIQALRKHGTMNLTQLAEKLRLKHSTVSKLVDRMERDQLLVRVQSTEDRRSCKLRLTDRALDRVEGLSFSVADFLGRLMRYLEPTEQAQLFKLVAKLANGFYKELGQIRPKK